MTVNSIGYNEKLRVFPLYVGNKILRDSSEYLVKNNITELDSLKYYCFDFDKILYETLKLLFILSWISLYRSNTTESCMYKTIDYSCSQTN